MRVAVLSCLLLAACAQSSGVLKLGPDTYTVQATAPDSRPQGSANATRLALTQANQHCTGLARDILVTETTTAPGTAAVTFRCLQPGDPGLRAPVYRQAPDIVIEKR